MTGRGRGRAGAGGGVGEGGDAHLDGLLATCRDLVHLNEFGAGANWDSDLFARYCWAESLSARLMVEIDRDGALVPGVRGGEMVKHKSWAPLRQLIAEMLSIGSRFGLSPLDRSSIKAAPAPPVPGGPERLLSERPYLIERSTREEIGNESRT